MPLDLARLTCTPDVRFIPALQARLIGALRYSHVARQIGRYSENGLIHYLGSAAAILPFHAFADTLGGAWPDPVCLHPPCQTLLSYDEMLILDINAAAAIGDRRSFDAFLEEMLSARARDGIWQASRRLMAAVPAG